MVTTESAESLTANAIQTSLTHKILRWPENEGSSSHWHALDIGLDGRVQGLSLLFLRGVTMSGYLRCLALVACVIMWSVGAFASSDRAAPQGINPQKGNLEEFSSLVGIDVPIPDDAYDGSIGSMVCLSAPGINNTITNMQVQVAIEHTWVGDLVIKLVSPSNEILTLMSRPGFAEPADDGTGCCGHSSNMVMTAPVTFEDAAGTSAEDLGAPLLVVCDEDGICNYYPYPDTGPGTNLAQFNGQNGAGTWQVCVGDAAGGDTGEFASTSVIFNGQSGDLEITKDIPDGVVPGGNFDFGIAVVNNGPGDQSGVVVTDTLPPEVTYVSDNCGGGAAGQNWTWTIGNLTNGGSASCLVTVNLANPDCIAVTNTADVTGAVSDPVPGNNSATASNAFETVDDGGFEDGTPNSYWAEASTNFGTPLCDIASCGTGTGTGPYMGDWWVWFGGISATTETGSVAQTVNIPVGTTEMTFWFEAIVCDSAADFMNVTIDGNVVYTIDGGSALCGSLGYTQQVVDISAYADDGDHALEFISQTVSANGGGTNFFVDDVSIAGVVCSAGQPPQPDEAIPTLSTTGMALLIGLLIGAGLVLMRRLG